MNICLGSVVRICLGCGVLVAGMVGCQEFSWEPLAEPWRESRPVRPSQRVDRPKDKPTTDKPKSLPAKAVKSPAAKPAGRPGRPETFYQVVLISEPASLKTPPDMIRLRLRQAEAEHAARLLEMLYVAVGVGGGSKQHYLVYQTPSMWKAAGAMAVKLDVKIAAESSTRMPGQYEDAFRKGVGLAMRALQPGRLDQVALKNAESCLKVAVVADAAPAKLRWAAAILAGQLLAELGFQFDQANTYYHLAEGYVPDGSLEKMIALYRQADVLQQDGRSKEALPLLKRVVRDFAVHADTNVYQRCERLLAK